MRNMDRTCHTSQKLKNILQSAARRAKDAAPCLGLPLPQMYSRLKKFCIQDRCQVHIFTCLAQSRGTIYIQRLGHAIIRVLHLDTQQVFASCLLGVMYDWDLDMTGSKLVGWNFLIC